MDGQFSPDFTVDVGLLDLDLNGRPIAGQLELVSGSAISTDPWSGRVDLVSLTTPEVGMREISPRLAGRALRVGLAHDKGDRFAGWERSPDGRWMVVRTEAGAEVLAPGRSGPAYLLQGRAYDGAFSKNGGRYAAVVEDLRGKRWVVLSPSGLVREGAVVSAAMSQFGLSPDGSILTFSRQPSPREPVSVVAVDLASGQEHVLLAIPDGTRYYSADGKTLAVLRPDPGNLRLFDVTNPLDPVELAMPFQVANSQFITAALSGDGSLVAVQVLEAENNPHRTLTRVLVLDRALQQRSTVISRTDLGGLQFIGRFLFVGTQRHPIPTYFLFSPTTQIKLYDLSGL